MTTSSILRVSSSSSRWRSPPIMRRALGRPGVSPLSPAVYHRSLLPSGRLLGMQRRSYFYFPTDLSELSHRWNLFFSEVEKRKVTVRLWRNQMKEKARNEYEKGQRRVRQQHADGRRVALATYQDAKIRGRRLVAATRQRAKTTRNRLNRRQALMLAESRATLASSSLYWRERSSLWKERSMVWRDRSILLWRQRLKEASARWSAPTRPNNNAISEEDSTTKSIDTMSFTKQTITLTEYSQEHWFDPVDGRPLTSRDPSGRFVNPWSSVSSDGVHSAAKILKWKALRFVREFQEFGWRLFLPAFLDPNYNDNHNNSLPWTTPSSSVLPRHAENPPKEEESRNKNSDSSIGFQWIGHNTCLVKMANGGATLLTDPIFSRRASPFQHLPIGIPRDVPPSLTVPQLPPVDVCLISHDHYDHMDKNSVLDLKEKVQWWVVPLGIQEWLETQCEIPSERIVELEWWETLRMEKKKDDSWSVVDRLTNEPPHRSLLRDSGVVTGEEDDVTHTMSITCCPAQHWCSRTFFDRNKRLWCSFAVSTEERDGVPKTTTTTTKTNQSFFFAGDTAFPNNGFPLFRQIGEFCGGYFDLAAIPIGAYEPAFLMQDSHMNPEEAVRCAQQLGARTSVGIHWGSFALSEEGRDDPPQRLEKALEETDLDFRAVPTGTTLEVPCRSSNQGRTNEAA